MNVNEPFKNISGLAWFNLCLLGLLLIILPSFSPFFDVPYTPKRVFQMGFLSVLVLQAVLFRKVLVHLWQELITFPSMVRYTVGSVLALGFISAIVANHPFYAFLEIGMFILLFIFLLFVIHFYKQAPQAFVFMLAGMLSVMVLVYFTRFSITYINNFLYPAWPVWPNTKLVQIMIDGEPLFPEPFLGFVHARFLNHLHTWSLPLFALFVVSTPKKYWTVRGLLFFITCFWWMLVFAADARGAILASVLSLILVFVLFRTNIKEWCKVYLLTFVSGLASYFFFFKVIMPEGSRTILTRFTGSGRLTMWENAFDLFLQNPILGAGPMHFADISNGFKFAHPHNFYVQILSEWGIIVFVLLATVFVFGCMKWFGFCRKNMNSESPKKLHIKAALTASLAAGAMHSFISGLMHTPLSQILMVIVLGWAIGLYYNEKGWGTSQIAIPQFSVFKIWLIRLGAAAVLVFMLWGTAQTLQTLDEGRIEFYQDLDNARLFPRYWDHGIIGVEDEFDTYDNSAP